MNTLAIIFDKRVSGTTKSRLAHLQLILPMPEEALDDASEIYDIQPKKILESLLELERLGYVKREDGEWISVE